MRQARGAPAPRRFLPRPGEWPTPPGQGLLPLALEAQQGTRQPLGPEPSSTASRASSRSFRVDLSGAPAAARDAAAQLFSSKGPAVIAGLAWQPSSVAVSTCLTAGGRAFATELAATRSLGVAVGGEGDLLVLPVSPLSSVPSFSPVSLTVLGLHPDLAVQGLVAALLSCAGYTVEAPPASSEPLLPAPGGSIVYLLSERCGRGSGERNSASMGNPSVVVGRILPPRDDPSLRRVPTRFMWPCSEREFQQPFVLLDCDRPLPRAGPAAMPHAVEPDPVPPVPGVAPQAPPAPPPAPDPAARVHQPDAPPAGLPAGLRGRCRGAGQRPGRGRGPDRTDG